MPHVEKKWSSRRQIDFSAVPGIARLLKYVRQTLGARYVENGMWRLCAKAKNWQLSGSSFSIAPTPGATENQEEKTSICQFMNISSTVSLLTAVALAEGRKESCYCLVLLGTGSQRSFLLKSLSEKLGCKVKEKETHDGLLQRTSKGKSHEFGWS